MDASALRASLTRRVGEQEVSALGSMEASSAEGVGPSGQGSRYVLSRRPFPRQGGGTTCSRPASAAFVL